VVPSYALCFNNRMFDPAIRVEGLGKRYRIGLGEVRYRTLRETVANLAAAPARRLRQLARGERRRRHDQIWALQNLDLEVQRGEVLGIIGRNGAGKSTLLKILSRITEPTTGHGELRGRVGSLLEVGTGFHPELTGRENIYLNGAILGMRRREIDDKFDEIVEFAEVERFLETPVKRYSSGMYVRLAFAVAAHMNSEILLIDEVLAVGDLGFRKKCMTRMGRVAEEGRTVLFVSHSMPAINRICKTALLLDGGKLQAHGAVNEVTSLYLRSGSTTTASREWASGTANQGDSPVLLTAVRVRNEGGDVSDLHEIHNQITLEMEYEVIEPGVVLVPNFHVFDETGVCVFIVHDTNPEWRRRPRSRGRYCTRTVIPGNFLSEGMFIVSAAVSTHLPLRVHVFERDALAFQVVESTQDGTTARGDYAGHMPGVVRPLLEWETTHHPSRLGGLR